MRADLASRELVDRRRSMLGWAIGLAGYALLVVAIWPTVRDSPSLRLAIEDYPDALKEFFGGQAGFDVSTGAGFVNAEMYAVILPVLLLVVAVGMGASLGGDQRSGLMDLVLANPVSRRRVVLERALAMAATVVGLGAVVIVVLLVGGAAVDLSVGVGDAVAATTAVALLVLLHGFVSLAASGATGRRSVGVGVATAAFAAGYVLTGLGGLVDWLEPYRPLAPYHWAMRGTPLSEGWDLGAIGILAALCGLVLAAAVELFERRDIT